MSKMNGVEGEWNADGSAEQRAKMRSHQLQGEGKEEDEWRYGGSELRTDLQRKEQK